jgi:hypothetical protein
VARPYLYSWTLPFIQLLPDLLQRLKVWQPHEASYSCVFYVTIQSQNQSVSPDIPILNTTCNVYVQRNVETRSRNHFCHRNAKCFIYYERVSVALVIQHAMRMRRTMLYVLSGSTIFSTLSHKRHDFRKIFTEHKMCVLIFSTNFIWNISHSKKNQGRYYHKHTSVFMYSTRYSGQILTL